MPLIFYVKDLMFHQFTDFHKYNFIAVYKCAVSCKKKKICIFLHVSTCWTVYKSLADWSCSDLQAEEAAWKISEQYDLFCSTLFLWNYQQLAFMEQQQKL